MPKLSLLIVIFCLSLPRVGFGDPTTPVPIRFYGKVVDENNKPVSGASVKLQVIELGADPYDDSGIIQVATDDKGLFSLTGKKGLGVGVSVWKTGYYVSRSENQDTWLPTAEKGTPLPTKDNPAIFHLRTQGVTEPLKKIEVGPVTQDTKGTPKKINLLSGKVDPISGQLTVQVTADKAHVDISGHFDWSFTLTIAGGGLQPRKGEFDFMAPSNGYQESVTLSFPQASGTTWAGSSQKQFFIKMANGQYVRGEFVINAGFQLNDPPFWNFSGYLNPTGSANLELDPAKIIQ